MPPDPGCAYRGTVISYQWRGAFASAEVEAFTPKASAVLRVTMLEDPGGTAQPRLALRPPRAQLAGFVNVAWDGGVHAFNLDTVVAWPLRRRGIGTRLVEVGAREARRRMPVAPRRLRRSPAPVLLQ